MLRSVEIKTFEVLEGSESSFDNLSNWWTGGGGGGGCSCSLAVGEGDKGAAAFPLWWKRTLMALVGWTIKLLCGP